MLIKVYIVTEWVREILKILLIQSYKFNGSKNSDIKHSMVKKILMFKNFKKFNDLKSSIVKILFLKNYSIV